MNPLRQQTTRRRLGLALTPASTVLSSANWGKPADARTLRAIFGAAVVAQPTLAADAPRNIILEAVADLSDDDPAALDAARRALRDGPSEHSPFAELPAEMREFATIADSLAQTGRLISLDWKDALPDAQAKFTALLAKSGIDAKEAQSRIAQAAEPAADSEVGIAYAAFRVTADAAGMRIVGLDADSDMCHFALVPKQRAGRRTGIRIEPNQYIEDSDRHFVDALNTIGVPPRSTAHRSQAERPPVHPVTLSRASHWRLFEAAVVGRNQSIMIVDHIAAKPEVLRHSERLPDGLECAGDRLAATRPVRWVSPRSGDRRP